MESNNFAHWLTVHKQDKKGTLNNPSEVELIDFLYYGDDQLALRALKELKTRFRDELHSLEENNRNRSHDADNWN
jgi:hypothetical protein